MVEDFNLHKKRSRGQTTFEFILLLMVLTTISFGILSFTQKSLAKRWLTLVKIITSPTSSPVEFR